MMGNPNPKHSDGVCKLVNRVFNPSPKISDGVCKLVNRVFNPSPKICDGVCKLVSPISDCWTFGDFQQGNPRD